MTAAVGAAAVAVSRTTERRLRGAQRALSLAWHWPPPAFVCSISPSSLSAVCTQRVGASRVAVVVTSPLADVVVACAVPHAPDATGTPPDWVAAPDAPDD